MPKDIYQFTSEIQEKILALLWKDTTSYTMYRECVKPKYFSKAVHIDLCRIIMDYRDTYGDTPTYGVLVEEVTQMLKKRSASRRVADEYMDCLQHMAEYKLSSYEYLKDRIVEFAKRQAMAEAIMKCAEIIESKSPEDYNRIPELVMTAQQVGSSIDLGINYWENCQQRVLDFARESSVVEKFPTGMKALDTLLKGGLGRQQMGVVLAPPGRGKALAPETPVLSIDGYIPIGMLSLYDRVIAVDGTLTMVTGIFHHKNKKMYRVTFTDGSSCVCCDEHSWKVHLKMLQRYIEKNHKEPDRFNCWRVMELKTIIQLMKSPDYQKGDITLPAIPRPFKFNYIIDPRVAAEMIRQSNKPKTLKSIEYLGRGDAVCIMVDHPSHLFIINDGIVTHNTTFLINCAANAVEEHHNVVHISLENDIEQIAHNYDLRFLNATDEKFTDRQDDCYKAMGLNFKYRSQGSLFLKKFPTKTSTTLDIKNYLNQLKIVHGVSPDVLIVDYGALLLPRNSYKDKRNNIESCYEDLRALCDEFNCALWTGAQANRGSLSKKVVNMGDLAEAFAIANTADVMFALCQTKNERLKNQIRGFLTKNREGKDQRLLQGTIQYDTKTIDFQKDITEEKMSEMIKDSDDEDDWEDDEPRRKKRRRGEEQ